MRTLFLLAGAAALIGASPALAKPGQGKGHGPHAVKVKTTKVKTATVRPAKVKVAKVKASKWVGGCPTGLIWRGDVCLPPGQAKKVIAIGNRVPLGWSYTPWGSVPLSIRNNYEFSPQYRYIYRDGVVYAVDPGTRLISHILSALP